MAWLIKLTVPFIYPKKKERIKHRLCFEYLHIINLRSDISLINFPLKIAEHNVKKSWMMDCGFYKYEISKHPIKCRFQHPIQFVGNLETRGGVTSCYKFAVDIKIEKRVLLLIFRPRFIFRYPKILWFEVFIQKLGYLQVRHERTWRYLHLFQ